MVGALADDDESWSAVSIGSLNANCEPGPTPVGIDLPKLSVKDLPYLKRNRCSHEISACTHSQVGLPFSHSDAAWCRENSRNHRCLRVFVPPPRPSLKNLPALLLFGRRYPEVPSFTRGGRLGFTEGGRHFSHTILVSLPFSVPVGHEYSPLPSIVRVPWLPPIRTLKSSTEASLPT